MSLVILWFNRVLWVAFLLLSFFSKASALHFSGFVDHLYPLLRGLLHAILVFFCSWLSIHYVSSVPGAFDLEAFLLFIVLLFLLWLHARVPFRPLALVLVLAFIFVVLIRCLVSKLICSSLLGWSLFPIVWRSFFLFLVVFTVLPLGVNFSFSTVIVPLSILIRTWSTVLSTLLNICPLPVMMSCFCSASFESLWHLFFDCTLAVSVLSWHQSHLFCSSPLSPTILARHVLFGCFSDELRVVPRVFVYVLNVCKFRIRFSPI